MLQIVTFNIGGARKLRQPPHDPIRLGRDAATTLRQVIDPAQPTFIGLQETGWIKWSSGQIDAAHLALASALGDYRAAFAPELTSELHPHNRLWGRDAYTGMHHAAEGNGFVTNLAPTAWSWNVRAGAADFWTHTQISEPALYSTGNRDTQPRNLMVASVTHPDYGDIYLLNTHFGTLSEEDRHDTAHERTAQGIASRQRQAAGVLRVVEELRAAEQAQAVLARPIILVGDFNATPDAASMRDLQSVFELLPVQTAPAEGWTHTGHRILIDHIFVSDPRGMLPPTRCFIQTDMPFDDLTDHRAVIAIFRR